MKDLLLQCDHACPQCGGPVTIGESTRLVACPYCRVKHFIDAPGHFTYFIAPRSHNPADCLFVPYWRLRGMEVVFGDGEQKSSVVDASLIALDWPAAPPSLGFRTQTQSLRFALPATPGRFMAPAFDARHFTARLTRHRTFMANWNPAGEEGEDSLALRSLRRPTAQPAAPARDAAGLLRKILNADRTDEAILGAMMQQSRSRKRSPQTPRRTFIGETISLIYAPYYESNGRLIDGITNQALHDPGSLPRDQLERNVSGTWPTLRFMPTLCPGCGWDMAGTPESLALSCGHCMSMWRPDGSGNWIRMALAIGCAPRGWEAQLWLPFWKIEGSWKGLTLGTLADLIRLTRTPRVVTPAMEQQPLSFWVPAFTLDAERFLLLGRLLTAAQCGVEPAPLLPAAQIYPVTMPLPEACEATGPILYAMGRGVRTMAADLAAADFTCTAATLACLPFVRRTGEYVQPQLNIAVSANALTRVATP